MASQDNNSNTGNFHNKDANNECLICKIPVHSHEQLIAHWDQEHKNEHKTLALAGLRCAYTGCMAELDTVEEVKY